MPDEPRPVLSVEEALAQILDAVRVLESERADLLQAAGRVLAEPVAADRDIPPLANAAMDGYALRAADLESTPGRLEIAGEIAAGHVPEIALQPGQAMRIMTGAPIPAGADTVVRFEDTHLDGDRVQILASPLTGANVRQAGEDVRAGQIILASGTVLRPQEIGLLAAVGHTEVMVIRQPHVAILGTGDEIVPPDQSPGPGQIRDANSYTVAAQVRECGGVAHLLGVARDQEERVRQAMRQALDREVDFIITSGGVSAGDYDLVKQVLAAEGEIHFWSLNMKPGRPLAFGRVYPPSSRERSERGHGIPLLGLPGNPVAAAIGAELFARPALLKMQGFTEWAHPHVRARLKEPISRKDGRRHYLRVRLHETETGIEAALTGEQGSGILTSLVQADGLAIIPETVDHLPAGSIVDVILLPRIRT